MPPLLLSLFELPSGDSGLPARPGRPDRPRPTHFDPLGRSESLDEPPESPRVAPSRSTEHPGAPKVAPGGRPRGSERQFSTILGRFWGRFSRFFVADRARVPRLDFRVDFRTFSRLPHSSESTRFEIADPYKTSLWAMFREGQASRARTENRPKFAARALPERLARSSENRAKIGRKSVCERTVRRKLDFFVPGRDLASIWAASARSRTLPGALSGVPGHAWGSSGRSRDAPGTPQDAPETLPRPLRDALGRHEASREGPGTDFRSILSAPRPPQGSIFDRFSR